MSGKGSGRRPLKVSEAAFADNWERIFSSKTFFDELIESVKQANEMLGSGVTGSASGSNPEGSRSSLDSPANCGTALTLTASIDGEPVGRGHIYVDDATGK